MWAITTVTTVGYGDVYPITVTGRLIAVTLMIGGISLVGVVTATLASWVVQRVTETDTAFQAATAAQIDELRGEIRMLAEELRQSSLDQLGNRGHEDEHQHGDPNGVHLATRGDSRRQRVLPERPLPLQRDQVATDGHHYRERTRDQPGQPRGPVQVFDREQRAVAQQRERHPGPGQRCAFRGQRVRKRSQLAGLAQPATALAMTNPSATIPTRIRPTAR